MGIWYPVIPGAFYAPVAGESRPIFYWEALAVLCALRLLRPVVPERSRVLIYCDNQNTVQLFSTLAAKPAYNTILKSAVDILIEKNWDLRVKWIASEENAVADAVSRHDFAKAVRLCPRLQIQPVAPP
ncbi:hypothetical protein CONPUDRAFT_41559, partial [Coniophora puteana RWD-64-598 SS2]